MKGKSILNVLTLAIVATGLLSCSGNAKQEGDKAASESIARADSVKAAEDAAKAAAEAAEAARLDSIRMDSIEKVTAFADKIPGFSRLYNASDYSFLKNSGFSKSVSGRDPYSISDYDAATDACLKTTWTLKVDAAHYCTIVTEKYYEGNGATLTIVGAPEKLQQIVGEAEREQRKLGNDEHCSITIKGNKISWGCGA